MIKIVISRYIFYCTSLLRLITWKAALIIFNTAQCLEFDICDTWY
jgi:hypothetical protein